MYQSLDDGITAVNIKGTLPANVITGVLALNSGSWITTLLVSNNLGVYQSSVNGLGNWVGPWSPVRGGAITSLTQALVGATITEYATLSAANSYTSTNFGATWPALGSQITDGNAISYSANRQPTSLMSPGGAKAAPVPSALAAGHPVPFCFGE